MKAAVLRKFGVPLSVGQVADPVAGRSEVLVDVAAPRCPTRTGRSMAGQDHPTVLNREPGTGAEPTSGLLSGPWSRPKLNLESKSGA